MSSLQNLNEEIDTINGMVAMFSDQIIDIDAAAPLSAQYKELHDKYLELYFKKIPEAKKLYLETGLLNDIGYNYLTGIKSQL